MSAAAEVAIIDSGGANLASLRYALERLGTGSVVSTDAELIGRARRVLLPGVGAAGNAMARLREYGLDRLIPQLRAPLLGICLGMQLLFDYSEEGDTACLGVFPGSIGRIPARAGLPVPHMGWNTLELRRSDALLGNLGAAEHFYFVHSYAAPLGADTLAAVDYGGAFSAVVRRGNFLGVQFHPERSGRAGAQLLRNFLAD